MRRSQNRKAAGVGVIGKVFQILEAIAGSPSGLTLKPICDITGVHKSTAHRFLKHLRARWLRAAHASRCLHDRPAPLADGIPIQSPRYIAGDRATDPLGVVEVDRAKR